MKRAKNPESLMMSHGYEPAWSEGSVKPPLFLTSTFVFNTAEEGKAHFELAYGLREPDTYEECGLIYSRLNNPNLEILENRISLWDDAEACAVMQSGMAAVSTSLLTFVKPGQVLIYSRPTYGGTEHFISHYLQEIGIRVIGFDASHSEEDIVQMIDENGLADQVAMIYIETPANPTNSLIDIAMCKAIAQRYSSDDKQVVLAVDNTYMGPLWCKPMDHGADLVLYSATKYLGGHSDLIAGAIVGSADHIAQIKGMRTFLGNMPSPNTCWLLMRSLETLKIRMTQQEKNAVVIASSLQEHPMIESVNYLGLMTPADKDYDLYKRQYSSGGAMIAFTVKGGEKDAFTVLNHLNLIKLAVSLGGTESLAQHPATMTHAGLDPQLKADMGISDNLIRLSIGIENHEDLLADINQALSAISDAVLN